MFEILATNSYSEDHICIRSNNNIQYLQQIYLISIPHLLVFGFNTLTPHPVFFIIILKIKVDLS